MAYFDKYGVEFSDDRKTLVRCPKEYEGEYSIPACVTIIEKFAFAGCRKLHYINIPNGVASIGRSAFMGSGITALKIPNSVVCIESNTFFLCQELTTIQIANGVSHIGIGAFSSCVKLIEIELPNTVTSIGDVAFSGCSSLIQITFGENIEHVGKKVFEGCTSLSKIIWDVKDIEFQSFNTPFYYFDERNLHIVRREESLFPTYDIRRQITSFIFGKNVQNIPSFICERFVNLKLISISDNVKSIGNEAFRGCVGLTSVVISNNVTSIGENAFRSCSNLTSIIIPNNVTSIGDKAFRECTKLASLLIPSGVKSIGNQAFYYCKGLLSVELPNTLSSLGDEAFWGCGCLTSVSIPESISNIGERAFANCENLVSVANYERIIGIRANTFESCKQLNEKQNQVKLLKRREAEEQIRLQEQQFQEMLQGSILFFDTETTGTPRNYRAPVSDAYNWPRLVQLAWMMVDKSGNVLKQKSVIIKPDGFSIPSDASAVHGITTERAQREELSLSEVLDEFATDLSFAEQVVGHNIDFDRHIVGAELYRLGMDYDLLMDKHAICTMKSSVDFCAIPNPSSYFGGYKWPSLQELYRKLFNRDFADAHDALADITATKECFFELKQRGIL